MTQPPRSSTNSLRPLPLRALCVSVVLLLLALYALFTARQYQLAQATNQQRLAEWQAEQAFERRLDRIVEMKFAEPPSLREWLQEWQRQSGIPFTLRIGRQDPFDSFEFPNDITINLQPLPARDALQTLFRAYDLGWSPYRDEQILVFDDSPLGPQGSQGLLLPLHHPDAEAVARVLRDARPEFFQGKYALTVGPGRLDLVHHHPVHLHVAAIIKQLLAAADRAEGCARNVNADPAAWQPALLDEDPPAFARAVAALEKPVSLDAAEAPLKDVARLLAEQVDHPISAEIFLQLNEGWKFSGGLITYRAKNLPLSQLVQQMCPEARLLIIPAYGGRQLVITDNTWAGFKDLTFAYPVADLVRTSSGEYDHQPLIDLILELTGPGGWPSKGSDAHLGGGAYGPLLVATTNWTRHQEVTALLTTMRKAKSGLQGLSARSQLTPAAELRINEILRRPVELKYDGVKLSKILDELNERFEIMIQRGLPHRDAERLLDVNISCQLSAAPLEENLARMLTPHKLALMVSDRMLKIIPSEDQPGLIDDRRREFEVFNLRALTPDNSDAVDRIHSILVNFAFDDGLTYGALDDQAIESGDLLILQARPAVLDRARRVMNVLKREYFLSPQQIGQREREHGTRPILDDRDFRKLTDRDSEYWLFNVSDLLQPGGPTSPGRLKPGQLRRTLYQRVFLSLETRSDVVCVSYLDRFLSVGGNSEDCAKIRTALHDIRTGKLAVSPVQSADGIEADFWIHGRRNFMFNLDAPNHPADRPAAEAAP